MANARALETEAPRFDTAYTSLLPLTLLVIAAYASAFISEWTFALASFVLTLSGLYTLADFLFGKTSIGVFKILALTYCLGFGLSSFNTWYGNHQTEEALSLYVQYDYQTLCHGIAVICLSAALFFLLGEVLERGIYIETRELASSYELSWFVGIAFALVVVAYLHGSLGYMGFGNTDGKIDILGSAANWGIPPLFALSITKAIHSRTSRQRLVYWCLSASVAVLVLPLGRRVLIYTILTAALLLRFDPVVAAIKRRTKFLIVTLTLLFLGLGSFGFLYLRFATYELGTQSHYSMVELTSEALNVFTKRSYADVAQIMQENAESRGFVLGYNAAVLEFSETQQVAEGEGLRNDLSLAVPSAINPDKLEHLPVQEEILVDRLYQTNYIDEANTLLSAGAVDFGFLGAVLYPTALAVLTILLLRQAQRLLTPLLFTVVSLVAIYTILNLENTVTSYLVLFRDTALYSTLLSLFYHFRPRLRR